jgi:hypothetical protein
MHSVILIDPATRTVKSIETELDIQTLYKLLDCEMVETFPWQDMEYTIALVDEEGLLSKNIEAFSLPGYTQPVAGKIIVACVDPEEGDWCGFDNLAIMEMLKTKIIKQAQWWTREQVIAWKQDHHII